MAAVSAEAIEYLARELAGRAQHQHAAGLALRPPPICEQMMQDRQRERRGLAGAGLRNPDHVAARQNGGNGLRRKRDIADGARHPRVIWAVGESEGGKPETV